MKTFKSQRENLKIYIEIETNRTSFRKSQNSQEDANEIKARQFGLRGKSDLNKITTQRPKFQTEALQF